MSGYAQYHYWASISEECLILPSSRTLLDEVAGADCKEGGVTNILEQLRPLLSITTLSIMALDSVILSVILLSVTNKPIMPSVILLSVVAPW